MSAEQLATFQKSVCLPEIKICETAMRKREKKARVLVYQIPGITSQIDSKCFIFALEFCFCFSSWEMFLVRFYL